MRFADALFAYRRSESDFNDALCDAGFGDFESLGGDDYDCSIEICGVGNDARLTETQQRIIFDAGFARAYVNHKDGWETHYTWGTEFSLCRGWRRKRTETGFLITYWPEGWDKKKEWLTSGYMTIVPDPLEP